MAKERISKLGVIVIESLKTGKQREQTEKSRVEHPRTMRQQQKVYQKDTPEGEVKRERNRRKI